MSRKGPVVVLYPRTNYEGIPIIAKANIDILVAEIDGVSRIKTKFRSLKAYAPTNWKLMIKRSAWTTEKPVISMLRGDGIPDIAQFIRHDDRQTLTTGPKITFIDVTLVSPGRIVNDKRNFVGHNDMFNEIASWGHGTKARSLITKESPMGSQNGYALDSPGWGERNLTQFQTRHGPDMMSMVNPTQLWTKTAVRSGNEWF